MKHYLFLSLVLFTLSTNKLFSQERKLINYQDNFLEISSDSFSKKNLSYKESSSLTNNTNGLCHIYIDFDNVIIEDAVYYINLYAGDVGFRAAEENGNLVLYYGNVRAVTPYDIGFYQFSDIYYAWRDVAMYCGSNAITLQCQ